MTRLTRRTILFGSAAGVAAMSVTAIVLAPGMTGFLRRVVAQHFGPETVKIDGVEDFITDYAEQAGSGDWKKQVASRLYFSLHGDEIYRISAADELENRFLNTFLTRSNIIAIYQETATEFEYTDVDPWEPSCGLYLSSLAEAGS
ncbi:MAG: hypothetical protein NXH97_22600 [Rhodobacteraceae bacterium]|nr:hypothetical protein [Paracoccaceae bacterium]